MNFSVFRNEVINDIKCGEWIFRGQSNPLWGLESSYSRFCKRNNLEFSFNKFLFILEQFLTQVSDYMVKDYNSNMTLQQKMAFAQHHGLPTPLLDWSFSPYIAMYFAVSDKMKSIEDDDHVKIWALNINKLTQECKDELIWKKLFYEDSNKFIFIKTSNFYSRRITRQQGCFTLLNFDGDLDQKDDIKKKYKIELITYPVEDKINDIIRELKIMGITGSNLFDDIDYIAEDVMFDTILNS